MDIIIPTLGINITNLEKCLSSLRTQTRLLNIILVTPNPQNLTYISSKYKTFLLQEPHKNIKGSHRAVACNEGLKYAKNRLVAFLDDDVVVPPTWAEDMISYFSSSKIVGVTSGCIQNDKKKDFSSAVSRVVSIGSTHAKSFQEVEEVKSIPGYNCVYLRLNIKYVGKFDESVGGCEDRLFNIQLLKKGYKLLGVPKSPVEHRQNITPKSFFKQMWGYGWSRGRLLKIKHIFTPLHMFPSLGLLGFIIFTILFPPLEFPFPKSIVQTSILHSFPEKSLELYLFITGLWSYVLCVKEFSLVFWLKINLAFYIQHLSWALGYIKGLVD